jgi:hypothetical protein
VIEHLLEAVEVETVPDIFLIDLTEELVVLEVAEPTNPAVTLFRTV